MDLVYTNIYTDEPTTISMGKGEQQAKRVPDTLRVVQD